MGNETWVSLWSRSTLSSLCFALCFWFFHSITSASINFWCFIYSFASFATFGAHWPAYQLLYSGQWRDLFTRFTFYLRSKTAPLLYGLNLPRNSYLAIKGQPLDRRNVWKTRDFRLLNPFRQMLEGIAKQQFASSRACPCGFLILAIIQHFINWNVAKRTLGWTFAILPPRLRHSRRIVVEGIHRIVRGIVGQRWQRR